MLEWLPRPTHNLFWGVVYNTGHTPLFGVGSIVLLQLSKLLLGDIISRYRHHYYLAFVGCGVCGLASELFQFFQAGRDADPLDLARDLLGAAIFLSAAATIDNRARADLGWAAARPRLVRLIAAVALLANCTPIGLAEVAYRHRDRAFPALMTFDSYWETWFYAAHHGATSHRRNAPAEWTGHDGSDLLEVEFGRGYFPRLEIMEPAPDWRDYRTLVIDVYSPNEQPLELGVKIRDRFLRDTRVERYEQWFPIAPGPNRLVLDLDDVRTGPSSRDLNMATIRSLALLMTEQPEPVRLFIDDLRLE